MVVISELGNIWAVCIVLFNFEVGELDMSRKKQARVKFFVSVPKIPDKPYRGLLYGHCDKIIIHSGTSGTRHIVVEFGLNNNKDAKELMEILWELTRAEPSVED